MYINKCIYLKSMTLTERCALIVSALCHDIGHPGRNNAFFVNTHDELAMLYNDVSVLENFHACLTFKILSYTECNIFAGLTNEENRNLRSLIIDFILCTDMKFHFESVAKFKIRRNNEFNFFNNSEDRYMVARMCIKSADLGHGAVEWNEHFAWSIKITQEFYAQGDEEEFLGLAKTMLCDRAGNKNLGKAQCGFLEYVVLPLINELAAIDQSGQIKIDCIDTLVKNRDRWIAIQEGGEEVMLPHDTTPYVRHPHRITFELSTLLGYTPKFGEDTNQDKFINKASNDEEIKELEYKNREKNEVILPDKNVNVNNEINLDKVNLTSKLLPLNQQKKEKRSLSDALAGKTDRNYSEEDDAPWNGYDDEYSGSDYCDI